MVAHDVKFVSQLLELPELQLRSLAQAPSPCQTGDRLKCRRSRQRSVPPAGRLEAPYNSKRRRLGAAWRLRFFCCTFPSARGKFETRAGREVCEAAGSAFGSVATGKSIRLVETEFATVRVKVSVLPISWAS